MLLSAASLGENIKILDDLAVSDETVTVTAGEGNVVIMAEGKYLGLLETVYLASRPVLREKILSAAAENIENGITEEKIKW